MAPNEMTHQATDLRITEGDWRTLEAHLFPGDGDEHGAVLLCGIATEGVKRRLLVREVIPAPDGTAYIPGVRGYRHLTGEFVTQQLRRAHDRGLTYLAVHNHGGEHSVRFSEPDFTSHERSYPTLLQVSGNPVGALVVAKHAVAGDIWFPTGERTELDRVVIVGASQEILTPAPTNANAVTPVVFDRQSRVFGDAGQVLLQNMKVAVVGAGGVGMLIVQGLSRLGVGHLVVIDPQRVDATNLPRLPEATRLDAMIWLTAPERHRLVRRMGTRLSRTKIDVARRITRRAPGRTHFEGVVGDIADDATARAIIDCDFILLAADSMLARDVVNQIAYQYLIPVLQVGSKVVVDRGTGTVLDLFAVVRSLGTRPGCLRCNGLIDPVRLNEEALGDPVQIANQRYIDDPEVHAPSVITLNALGVGWALNDFLHYAVGLSRPDGGFRVLRNRPVHSAAPQLTCQEPHVDERCYVCGSSDRSSRALGDARELPTRI